MPSLKEMLAAKAAGTSAPAPAAPKGIIARASEPAAVPAKPLPTPVSQEPRQLGQIERGQDVPFEFPSEKSSEGAKTWLFARQQPETQLGIAIEPGETSDHAWIVVQSPTDPGKLLYLYRLPLLTPSSGGNPY